MGLGLVLALTLAAPGCSSKGEYMPPQNAQKTNQTVKSQADVLVASTATMVKGWKTEKDIVRDFPRLAVQLDSLARRGRGKDLLGLYNAIHQKLINLEGMPSLSEYDMHITIWEQVAKKPARTEAGTFAGIFLGLPRMGNVPEKMPPLFEADHNEAMKLINGILDEAAKSGPKFRAIASHIRKGWVNTWPNSLLTKEEEKVKFFETLREMYLKPEEKAPAQSQPASMPKRIIPVPAPGQEKTDKLKIVPLKKTQ